MPKAKLILKKHARGEYEIGIQTADGAIVAWERDGLATLSLVPYEPLPEELRRCWTVSILQTVKTVMGLIFEGSTNSPMAVHHYV